MFVPPRARWKGINKELHHNIGHELNKALEELEDENAEELEGVLDTIDFNRRFGRTRISDQQLRALITHFSQHRLLDEDFEFPDLLGAAYEYLIGEFADSAGKKGGEFYTPRAVVRLMVRIVTPQEQMRIYDPCVGSGGMLIQAYQYVQEHGGNPRNLGLYGQDNNGSVWSICKMNLLLHGIRTADIRNEDTLQKPQHLERTHGKDELMTFDRVLSNPPFSQNYSRDGLEFSDRFRYGFCPETGKKADLMFAQHMLAVLRAGGMMATVMPHGVLFRGGTEQDIRRKFIEADLLEAVIGLPANLFYGTGIPACILVMRAPQAKPAERKGQVLFINADAEYQAGRAQNYLRPEHIEKIVSTFAAFQPVPGYAAVVNRADLAANDYNLNIRRYADNAPPPEPHNVRAHLYGGVPKEEVAAKQALLQRHGLPLEAIFVPRPIAQGSRGAEEQGRDDSLEKANTGSPYLITLPGAHAVLPALAEASAAYTITPTGGPLYLDFAPHLTNRSQIKTTIESSPAVQTQEARLQVAFVAWWQAHEPLLRGLAASNGNNIMAVRAELLASFETALRPINLLDRFKVAGVIASWWEASQYELQTLAAQGFTGVIDSWITTIKATLEDAGPQRNRAKFNALDHKLVIRLLPGYLAEIAQAEAEVTHWEQEKAAFEQEPEDETDHPLSSDNGDEEAEAPANYAKALEERLIKARDELKTIQKRLKQPVLPPLSPLLGDLPNQQVSAMTSEASSPEALLESLALQAAALEQEMAELEEKLQPYREIKVRLNQAKKKVKQLKERLVAMLEAARAKLDQEECAEIVLELAKKELSDQLDSYVTTNRQRMIATVENWWDKYRITLQAIETEDAEILKQLNRFVKELGYAD